MAHGALIADTTLKQCTKLQEVLSSGDVSFYVSQRVCLIGVCKHNVVFIILN